MTDNPSEAPEPLRKQLGIPAIMQRLNAIVNFHKRLVGEILKFHQLLRQRSGGSNGVDKGTQMLLSYKYRELAAGGTLLPFADVEFRNYSQNGEDGILHYIFSLIGTTNRRAVEMCAGPGRECNCANLILNHGWFALLVDGNEDKVRNGLNFFGEHPDSKVMGPVFLQRWITRDNVNEIISEGGFSGEVDLLTIDMDGMDYWIWEAITVVNPRVVVLEFMPQLGTESLTVPYADEFDPEWIPLFERDEETGEAIDEELPEDLSYFSRWTIYAGASLAALNKVSKRKGYRLVGANSIGFNAFFIRNDVGTEQFPEVSLESCFNPNARHRLERAQEAVRDKNWVEV